MKLNIKIFVVCIIYFISNANSLNWRYREYVGNETDSYIETTASSHYCLLICMNQIKIHGPIFPVIMLKDGVCYCMRHPDVTNTSRCTTCQNIRVPQTSAIIKYKYTPGTMKYYALPSTLPFQSRRKVYLHIVMETMNNYKLEVSAFDSLATPHIYSNQAYFNFWAHRVSAGYYYYNTASRKGPVTNLINRRWVNMGRYLAKEIEVAFQLVDIGLNTSHIYLTTSIVNDDMMVFHIRPIKIQQRQQVTKKCTLRVEHEAYFVSEKFWEILLTLKNENCNTPVFNNTLIVNFHGDWKISEKSTSFDATRDMTTDNSINILANNYVQFLFWTKVRLSTGPDGYPNKPYQIYYKIKDIVGGNKSAKYDLLKYQTAAINTGKRGFIFYHNKSGLCIGRPNDYTQDGRYLLHSSECTVFTFYKRTFYDENGYCMNITQGGVLNAMACKKMTENEIPYLLPSSDIYFSWKNESEDFIYVGEQQNGEFVKQKKKFGMGTEKYVFHKNTSPNEHIAEKKHMEDHLVCLGKETDDKNSRCIWNRNSVFRRVPHTGRASKFDGNGYSGIDEWNNKYYSKISSTEIIINKNLGKVSQDGIYSMDISERKFNNIQMKGENLKVDLPASGKTIVLDAPHECNNVVGINALLAMGSCSETFTYCKDAMSKHYWIHSDGEDKKVECNN